MTPIAARRYARILAVMAGSVVLVAALAIRPNPIDLALFLAMLAAFTAPGWPLSRVVVGGDADRLTAATVALLLGYLTGAFTFGLLRLAGVTSPWAVLAACLALAGLLHVAARRVAPGVLVCARLDAADLVGVSAVWLVAAVIVGPVFSRVGAETAHGLAYRAYFIADLFAHMSVVGELAKDAAPPLNPFFPQEALPYYWTYFTLPGLFAKVRPWLFVDRGILLTDLLAAWLFVTTGYLVVRGLGASALATTISWMVLLVASSFEGICFAWRQLARQRGIDAFRYVNIDAVTRWVWDLPPVDGLHRLLWYTPQHAFALSLGLLALFAICRAREPDSLARGLLDGVLLGGAVTVSSFNGLMLVAAYAMAECARLAMNRGRNWGSWLLARGSAAVLVAACAGFTLALGMVQRTPGSFIFGMNHHFLRGPWTFAALSFGPALFLAPIGLAAAWRTSRDVLRIAVPVTAVSIVVFLLVDLHGHENSYVTFRTGQLFFLVLGLLLACAIDHVRGWSATGRAAFAVALVCGSLAAVPTMVMDWYNARDITNLVQSPGGFPWTIMINPDDQAATAWIRENVPVDATVQTDAVARARNTWAFVTAFAGRRMATGMGIFELNPSRFEPAVNRIREVFTTADARHAYTLARQFEIDYVYVGDVERQADQPGVAKFEHSPDQFELVFRQGTVAIVKVRR